MTEKDVNKFFGKETFLIEEDKSLSGQLLRHFGLETATILRGPYPIEKVETCFAIAFKMMVSTLDKPLIRGSKVA